MQIVQTVHQLLEKVANEWLRESFIDLDKPEQFAILCKVHHVVADGSLAFDNDWLLFFL